MGRKGGFLGRDGEEKSCPAARISLNFSALPGQKEFDKNTYLLYLKEEKQRGRSPQGKGYLACGRVPEENEWGIPFYLPEFTISIKGKGHDLK